MAKFFYFFKLFFFAGITFLLQFSFLNQFPGFLGKLNLFLLIIIYLFIFHNFKISLYFSLFCGLFLDIFSFYPFGAYSLLFLLTLILADFVWNNFFTNRSIYSYLTLSFFILLFFDLLLYSLIFLFENNTFSVIWFNKIFWFNLSMELCWIFLGIIFSFYFIIPKKATSGGSLYFDKN